MTTNLALKHACDAVGGQVALASKITEFTGQPVTQAMVWYWLNRAKKGVPGEFVLAIERASGVSRHALRPDIYPPTGDAGAAA